MLPTALVYLAEASWQLGEEVEADRLTKEAYSVASRTGTWVGCFSHSPTSPGFSHVRSISSRSPTAVACTGAGRRQVTVRPTFHSVRPPCTCASSASRPSSWTAVRFGRRSARASRSSRSFSRAGMPRPVVPTSSSRCGTDATTSRRGRIFGRQIKHLREALPEGSGVMTDGDTLSLVGAFTSETAGVRDALHCRARNSRSGSRCTPVRRARGGGRRGRFFDGSRNVDWVDGRRSRIAAWLVGARLDAADTLIGREPAPRRTRARGRCARARSAGRESVARADAGTGAARVTPTAFSMRSVGAARLSAPPRSRASPRDARAHSAASRLSDTGGRVSRRGGAEFGPSPGTRQRAHAR